MGCLYRLRKTIAKKILQKAFNSCIARRRQYGMLRVIPTNIDSTSGWQREEIPYREQIKYRGRGISQQFKLLILRSKVKPVWQRISKALAESLPLPDWARKIEETLLAGSILPPSTSTSWNEGWAFMKGPRYSPLHVTEFCGEMQGKFKVGLARLIKKNSARTTFLYRAVIFACVQKTYRFSPRPSAILFFPRRLLDWTSSVNWVSH